MPKARAPKKAAGGIKWHTLSHAYGKGTDLPQRLEALGSDDAEQRRQAIFMLGASICHQGRFFSATPVVVGKLIELLANPSTPDRRAILKVIGDVATIDDHERFLIGGYSAKPFGRLAKVYKQSLEVVRAGLPTYLALLGAAEADVRAAAAFVSCWLGEGAEEAEAAVSTALGQERDALARASFILARAYLADDAAAALAEVVAYAEDESSACRAAAALATCHLRGGKVDDSVRSRVLQGANDASLSTTSLLWQGGDLSMFCTRALAALAPGKASNAALTEVVERGVHGAFAANVLARRILGRPVDRGPAPQRDYTEPLRRDREEEAYLAGLPKGRDDLSAEVLGFLRVLAGRDDAFDGHLLEALRDRALPATPSLVRRFLGDEPARSLLDRELAGGSTVAEAILDAAQGPEGEAMARATVLVNALTADEAIEVAMDALVMIEAQGLVDFLFALVWVAGPHAGAALDAAHARAVNDGVLRRLCLDGGHSYESGMVMVGLAMARRATAKGEGIAASVDGLLQYANGFEPLVKATLVNLPIERREAWVLHPERDDQAFPVEYFGGAWPYFDAAPTARVVDRALEHLSAWTEEEYVDREGNEFALPHAVALRDAVHEAGGDTGALDAAIARWRAVRISRSPSRSGRRR